MSSAGLCWHQNPLAWLLHNRWVHALRVLEFDAIRKRLQGHCETPLGAAWAEAVMPSFNPDDVWDRLEDTREAMEFLAHRQAPSLGALRDPRTALDRAAKGASLGGSEIFQIGDSFYAMRGLRAAVGRDFPRLWRRVEFLPVHERLEGQIFASLESDGTVKDAASPELQKIRQRKRAASQRIQERIQSYTTGSTRELLSDPITTMRDGRHVIPVKAEHKGKVRGIVHDSSATGATVFIEPEDVLQLGNALREIEAAERVEELRVLQALSGKIGAVASEAIAGVESAGEVDFLLAKAKLGYELKGKIPDPLVQPGIQIQGGRHPMLDRETTVPLDIELFASSPKLETPNSKLQTRQGSVLITGPNTGGKTVAIKTVGLFVLMAQSGIPIPAVDARLGPFTQMWADIGDEQSLEQSLSTFSGHIKNIAAALQGLQAGALVLMDEVGAGTDPAEGAALARAVLLKMHEKGAAILASTHYGELKAFAANTEGFQNAAMEFDMKSLRPTYRLMMGTPGASQALRIAERCGLPRAVVDVAKLGLGEQQQDLARMLEKLEIAQRLARTAQGEADRRLADLERKEKDVDRRLREAKLIRENAHARGQEAVEGVLREIRLEGARLFEELKAGADRETVDRVRKELKGLQSVGQEFASELAPRSPGVAPTISKGTVVRIEGYGQTGTVIEEPKGGKVVVQVGVVRLTVAVGELVVLPSSPPPKLARKANLGLSKAQTASTELHLRMMRAEDAERELDRFLDDAILAGLDSVRIVHGKGEGILRRLVHDFLRRQKSVRSFRLGDAGEGGDGVTIAVLR